VAKAKMVEVDNPSPRVYLYDEYASQFRDIVVGEVFDVTMKVKLKRKSKSDDGGKKAFTADLDIQKITVDSSVEKKLEGKSF